MTRPRRAGRAGLWAVTLAWAVALATASAGVGPAAPASTPGATIGCPPHDRGICVDRADGGRTVPVRVGQAVTVALSGATLRWSGLRQVGPALLHRNGAVRRRAGGLAASYTAVQAGRTTLRASGAPKCAPTKACPQFIVVWQVHLIVR
jgi:hypothetical protein